MATDYLDMYDKAIGNAPVTAAARRQGKKRHNRLTRHPRKAQLSIKRKSSVSSQRRTPLRSASEENVVAKKKRTAAQKRATAKMIRANKAKRRAEKRTTRAKTKHPRKSHRSSRKSHEKRRKSTHRKKAAHARKSTKRSRAAKKAARTREEKHAKRSRAAKKAARTRKRHHGGGGKKRKGRGKKRAAAHKTRKTSHRKKTRGRKKSRNKGHPKGWAHPEGYAHEAAESRKSRKGKRRHKKNPLAKMNPIPLEGGLDFFSGLFAVTIGYLTASAADRLGSTHALTASSAQGGFVDAPAAGQIYDSEATLTPIWSSGMRIAFNALAIAVPMGLSAIIKSKGPKSWFQLMGFAAAARVLGKAADDGMSMALKTTGFGLRVYGGELAAQAKLASAATAALPNAAPATFAGVRQNQQLPSGAPVVNHAPPPPPRQQNAAPPPSFEAPKREVAGAPSNPLNNGERYISAPAFNPFASTDS